MNNFNKYFRYFIYMFLGAAVFSLVGLLPTVYYESFDNTKYFNITKPVDVDKTFYKPGDVITLTTTLEVKEDLDVDFVVELRKLINDKDFETVDVIRYPGAFKAHAENIIVTQFQLPIANMAKRPLASGKYLYQISAQYNYRGRVHTTTYISELFNINDSGTSGRVQEQLDTP